MSEERKKPEAFVQAPLVVLDLESTFPGRKGSHAQILEIGILEVNPQGLFEVGAYCTLVHPSSLSAVTKKCYLTQDQVASAPSFADVADRVYDTLHGRIVMGHNITAFDLPLLNRAFETIGHRLPVLAGVVDTYTLVRASPFSNRAGNNTLDALSRYTGGGAIAHRALSDCRATLEMFKVVSARMTLEKGLPSLFPAPPPRPPKKKRTTGLEKELEALGLDEPHNPSHDVEREQDPVL
jgi:DNA polymerase III epsilon subunit-like protein